MRTSVSIAILAGVLAFASAVSPVLAARTDIVVGMVLEPPNLDPTAGADGAIDEVGYANVFEGLTRFGPDGSVNPGLAQSWDISKDGLTYTFHLHAGVTFHDGTEMDAEDVKFSLDRARAADSTNAQKALFADIADVAVIDPATVEVTLSQPNGSFLFNMAWGDAVIVAPESADSNATHPIGTGPFEFADWVQGDHVDLVRYLHYWGKPVRLDKVTFKFIGDPTAGFAAMMAGDIDAFPYFPAPETLPQLAADPRFDVILGSTEGETVVAMNNKREPFSDIRVREAIAHAINRQEVIDGAMFGYGTPIGTFFAPHNPAYVDLTALSDYDPEKSKALLAEAGYEDGFKTTLVLPPTPYARRGGEVVAAQLAEVGITAKIENVEWAQWLAGPFKGDYDMTIVSHTEPFDIGAFAIPGYYFGYDNPAFNEIIAELNKTADPEKRTALVQKAEARLAKDYAAVFLFQLAKTTVADKRIVGLWENSPAQANDMTEVYWED
jgi:peptide/nickel transport system substrate-binding protein